MLVFIDSSIFFNHWYLRAPIFDLLANYLSNQGGTLLVSEVVRREVEAKFKAERLTVARDLAVLLSRVGHFQAVPADCALPQLDGEFDFLSNLGSKFDRVEVVPFKGVDHEELVTRAINSTRPFRDGEKGYRDSLIWLSLLEHLKSASTVPEKLLFVNANYNDFFEKGSDGGFKLHTHLRQDLKELGIHTQLVPFLSLKELAEREIDPILHSIRHEEFEEAQAAEMEYLAATTAVRFLQEMPLVQLQDFLEDGGVPRRFTRLIRNFTVEDFEGLEDPKVLSLSSLNDQSLYVRYRFNLLTVIYQVEVSAEEYFANVDDFDKYFMNIDIGDRAVQLQLLRRCDFEASFAYSQKLGKFTFVSIDFSALRRDLKRPRTRE